MTCGYHKNQEDSRLCSFRVAKGKDFCFKKTTPEYHIPEQRRPREVVPWDLVHKPLTPAAKREGSLATATACGRPWHYVYRAGFRSTKSYTLTVVELEKCSPRFQKAWNPRQCVAGEGSV